MNETVSEARADEPRARVLALLRRHGWNATSFQVLGDGFRYWFDGDDACVAYADTGGAWVAAGAPLASPARLGEVAQRFSDHARAMGRRACFFAAERRLIRAATGRAPSTLVVGEQPVWDPAAWHATVRGARSLREQIRRARAHGVAARALDVADVAAHDAPMRGAIDGVIARWLATRPMAPMGFLVAVQPFDFAAERRYFVAERDGAVVGFLVAVPVYTRNGWFFEDLVRDPRAPNGTSELLVDAAMRRVAAEGSRYVTLGLAPLAGEVGPALRLARRWLAGLYDFRGLRAFKARLRPQSWEPIYLVRVDTGLAAMPVALHDALAAFARGSFARFGLQTARRIARRLVAALRGRYGLPASDAGSARST